MHPRGHQIGILLMVDRSTQARLVFNFNEFGKGLAVFPQLVKQVFGDKINQGIFDGAGWK